MWSGPCPECGHDRTDHTGSQPAGRTDRDATEVYRCDVCSCAVTAEGRVWPTAAAED